MNQKIQTTSQRLAAYDAAQRKNAGAHGAPIQRCAAATVEGTPSHVIYLGPRGVLRICEATVVRQRADRPQPTTLRVEDLSNLASTKLQAQRGLDRTGHQPIVFADETTFKRVSAKVNKVAANPGAAPELRALARQLVHAGCLPRSLFFPVLTNVLAERFWLPAGSDPKVLDDWARAFPQLRRYAAHTDDYPLLLTRLATLCAGSVETTPRRWLNDLFAHENYGLLSATSASRSSANKAFQRACRFTDLYGSLIAADPLLRERNVIAGTVGRMRITEVRHTSFRAALEGEFKIREGQKTRITTAEGDHDGEVTFRKIAYESDQMFALFDLPQKTRHLVERAYRGSTPIYATALPILMAPAGSNATRRWTQNPLNREKIDRGDVPLDVLLAGATITDTPSPTAGQAS